MEINAKEIDSIYMKGIFLGMNSRFYAMNGRFIFNNKTTVEETKKQVNNMWQELKMIQK